MVVYVLIMVHRDFTCFLRVFSVLPRTHFEIWRPFILDHVDATSLAGGGQGGATNARWRS